MQKRTYSDSDFANPELACDVVMKGGVTSGVVYPLAIAEVAKRYRFSSIGGTSAGAIVAAATAAAEYGRHIPGKGFRRLAQLPDEVGPKLFSLFQPTPRLKPLFGILVAVLKAKTTSGRVGAALWAALSGHAGAAALGALPGLVVLILALWKHAVGFGLFGALLLIVGVAAAVAAALLRDALVELPRNNYGMCPGIRQPGYGEQGFTDWIADVIDDAAGRDPGKDPALTFGDLEQDASGTRRKIELKMMTTNLMLRRPYSLPLHEKTFKFKREDFEKLFPPRILAQMMKPEARFEPKAGEEGEFYEFPDADKLPIVVAARMSLSFPLLISAVPLYAQDFTMRTEQERDKLRLCLFSDGGLSSNFPIHFFDHLLPNTPTFGISLGDYDGKRDPLKNPSEGASSPVAQVPPAGDEGGESRVWMPSPSRATGGLLLPIEPFSGLVAFAMRLIDAAKDWQDNLQGTLAGYRERIVHVYLKPEEGGLNITMPAALTDQLSGYGAQAGDMLRDGFDLDEHRWRRFLVAVDRMNDTLATFARAFHQQPDGPEPYGEFLTRYPAKPPLRKPPLSYPQDPPDLDTLRGRAAALAELGRKWDAQPAIEDTKFPHPKSDLRITPKP